MFDAIGFSKNLAFVINKIHAAKSIDEIMLEVSKDICEVFNADRGTIYVVSDDKTAIVSKVKTGSNSFKAIKLPIGEQSIAGYVALSKNLVNVKDVYDDEELRAHSPKLSFPKWAGVRAQYRVKQMLAAPVLNPIDNELIGVVQIVNSKSGQPFPRLAEGGVIELAKALALVLGRK